MNHPLWNHQQRSIAEIIAAIGNGEQSMCCTSPTGGGKTRIMEELIWWNKARGGRTILFTNRKLLLEQMTGVLDRKSTRLNSSHIQKSRMPSSA